MMDQLHPIKSLLFFAMEDRKTNQEETIINQVASAKE